VQQLLLSGAVGHTGLAGCEPAGLQAMVEVAWLLIMVCCCCHCSESESSSAVTSLSWSRNGRYLLSGQSDERNKSNNKIILWDVLSGEQVRQPGGKTGATAVLLAVQ